jgi:hypothetical protein
MREQILETLQTVPYGKNRGLTIKDVRDDQPKPRETRASNLVSARSREMRPGFFYNRFLFARAETISEIPRL